MRVNIVVVTFTRANQNSGQHDRCCSVAPRVSSQALGNISIRASVLHPQTGACQFACQFEPTIWCPVSYPWLAPQNKGTSDLWVPRNTAGLTRCCMIFITICVEEIGLFLFFVDFWIPCFQVTLVWDFMSFVHFLSWVKYGLMWMVDDIFHTIFDIKGIMLC